MLLQRNRRIFARNNMKSHRSFDFDIITIFIDRCSIQELLDFEFTSSVFNEKTPSK